jgi:peptidoglycan/LPS O-acetylase OafA/YrhL
LSEPSRIMEKRVYFKNLNALRFFAAVAVIFHHVEQYKFWSNLPNVWGNTSIDALGHKAVSFFFVLSGFLITYLLMEEHKRTDDISIRNFYVRRILRIWPLYYLIVLICMFFLPFVFDTWNFGGDFFARNYWLVTILLLLVLPNLVRTFVPNVVGGNQLWSIGVEEQFYLVWPVLVKKYLNRLLTFLFGFIFLKVIITVGLETLAARYDIMVIQKLLRLWVLLQVEQMAVGAIGAWVLFNNKERILSFIYKPAVFYLSCLLIGLLFIIPVHHWWIHYAEAVVFTVLIMNLSTNPAIKLSLETKGLNTLGNISYGIYMYHTVCITFCLFTLKYFSVPQYNYTLFNVLLYGSSIIMTLGVSYLSYEIFEKRFLEFKERFMVVKSGADQPAKSTSHVPAKAQWSFMRLVPQWVMAMYRRYRI